MIQPARARYGAKYNTAGLFTSITTGVACGQLPHAGAATQTGMELFYGGGHPRGQTQNVARSERSDGYDL